MVEFFVFSVLIIQLRTFGRSKIFSSFFSVFFFHFGALHQTIHFAFSAFSFFLPSSSSSSLSNVPSLLPLLTTVQLCLSTIQFDEAYALFSYWKKSVSFKYIQLVFLSLFLPIHYIHAICHTLNAFYFIFLSIFIVAECLVCEHVLYGMLVCVCSQVHSSTSVRPTTQTTSLIRFKIERKKIASILYTVYVFVYIVLIH